MFTCEYVQVMVFYLLCGAGWQKLYVILFVTRYSSREEDGMLLGVVCDKGHEVLYHVKRQSVFWFLLGVAMSPGCQARRQKASFQSLKLIFPCEHVLQVV